MHLFEEWYCKPKLEIDLYSHADFESNLKHESAYSIYYVCETEVNSTHKPFSQILNLYGELKRSVLYPCDIEHKQFFLIAPTQSEPKKLDLEMCGAAHIASHFGALLSQLILSLPIPLEKEAHFYITLSDKMKKLVDAASEDFLVGIFQRSLSIKIKKSKLSKPKEGFKTVVFREDLFSQAIMQHATIISQCMSVTRSLINIPANVLNPTTYAECIKFLAKQHNQAYENTDTPIEIEILDSNHLKNLGCELICAVGQGSHIPPCLVKLTAHPTDAPDSAKHIALVGKGITYDTGGYGLKPASFMRNMKKDMGGSAAALGVFFACAKLKLPIHLTCYLALAENMISGNAMRPGDIYKAHNGINVEIDHTDAEGRLVLADTLSLAAEKKPDWIIDLATLTGAARTALGPLVDPVFGNRSEQIKMLEKIGLETGDWVWHLPLPMQYNAYFDSKIADIMNSTTTPYAGCITAALFLQKFVDTCTWTHIDTFMWCDKPNHLWSEDNAPTAKCIRLLVNALRQM